MYLSNEIVDTAPLSQQVKSAAAQWHATFGGTADCIVCHPADVRLFNSVCWFTVRTHRGIRRGKYWLGVRA